MDIALRKDLIQIQEIIANPPPIKRHCTTNSSSGQKRGRQSADYYASRQHQLACDTSDNSTRRHQRQPKYLVSCSLASNKQQQLAPQQLSQLELRYSRLDLNLNKEFEEKCNNSSGNQAAPLIPLPPLKHQQLVKPANLSERELAVDVPSTCVRPIRQSDAHLRHLPDFQPDARALLEGRVAGTDEPKEEQATTANRSDVIITEHKTQAEKEAGQWKQVASKCNGQSRISAKLSCRHSSRYKRLLRKSGLNPNKLSLVQLRLIAQKRQRKLTKTRCQPNVEEQPEEEKSVGVRGRRFERNQNEPTGGEQKLLLAPNGTRLLVTKALASLTDQTQLYAIPRKTPKVSLSNLLFSIGDHDRWLNYALLHSN